MKRFGVRSAAFLTLLIGVVAMVAGTSAQAEPVAGNRIFLSSTSSGSAGGVSFADDDIVVFDSATGTWAMTFDGSDVGVSNGDIDGFSVISEDPLVIDMTFGSVMTIPGVGSVDDSDIVRFTGVGGPATSGTFALQLDGSDVGLTTSGEDIDAVAAVDGDVVISTVGDVNVPGLTGRDEDALRFSPTSPAPNSAGTFAWLVDGSDVGMARDDFSGLSLDDEGRLFGSALGRYTIDGFTGDGDDVFVFAGTFGADTSGSAVLLFDGDAHGFGGEQIDGVSVMAGAGSVETADVEVTVFADVLPGPVAPGDIVTFIVEVANLGPDAATNPALTITPVAGLTITDSPACSEDPNGVHTCPLPGDIQPGEVFGLSVMAEVNFGFTGEAILSGSVRADQLDSDDSNNSTSASLQVDGPMSEARRLFLSSSTGGSVGGVSFGDEDVLVFDPGDQSWAMVFDGSDVGLASADVDALSIISAADPLVIDLSLTAPRVFPGIGPVDDSDVVRFVGIGGPATSGEFSLLLDGSDVELGIPSEDIDAIDTITECATHAISTAGNTNGLAVDGRDEDYLLFEGTSFGEDTAGAFSMLFDGSDVGAAVDDLVGLAIDETTNLIYGAGLGRYDVAGFSGDRNDVFVFSGTVGEDTQGTAVLYFDGDQHQFGSEQIDGLDVELDGQASNPNFLSCDQPEPEAEVEFELQVNGLDADTVADGPAIPIGGDFGVELTLQITNVGTVPVSVVSLEIVDDNVPVVLGDPPCTGLGADIFPGETYGCTLSPGLTAAPTGKEFVGRLVVAPAGGGSPAPLMEDSGWYRTIDAPEITFPVRVPAGPALVDVPENQTSVLTVLAIDDLDVQGTSLQFDLSGGADTGLFSIGALTGVITFNDPPDFEDPMSQSGTNEYLLILRVTDTDGLTNEVPLNVYVTNVIENAAPQVSIASVSPVSVGASLALDGTVTDDGLPTNTLTIDWRTISGPGTATFNDDTDPDTTVTFDTAGQYVLALRATDGLLTGEAQVTVDVTAVSASVAIRMEVGFSEAGPFVPAGPADPPVETPFAGPYFYRAVITNTGTDTLTGLSITEDSIGPGVTVPGGDLAPGASRTIGSGDSGFEGWANEAFCEPPVFVSTSATVDATGLFGGAAATDTAGAEFTACAPPP